MHKNHPSLNGFLMFNAIVIFLLIGIFSSIMLPIIFGNKSQTTMYLLRYKSQSILENLMNQKVKDIAYTCPHQNEDDSFYVYDRDQKKFRMIKAEKNFDLKIKTKIDNLTVPALIYEKYNNQNNLHYFTKINSKLNNLVLNDAVVVTQGSLGTNKLLGIINNVSNSQLIINPINSEQIFSEKQKVVLNLCRIHLNVDNRRHRNNISYDQNNNELSINDGFQKIITKATAVLYKNDYYPTYRTPVVITEEIIINNGLTIKRPNEKSRDKEIGTWLLCKNIFPKKGIGFQYSNDKGKPTNPAITNHIWYDYNISSNINPNSDFERQFDILSKKSVVDLGSNKEFNFAELLELIQTQKLTTENLVVVKSSSDLKIYGKYDQQDLPKIVLIVNGNLTLEKGNFPFDLIMVKGQCTIKNANLFGYLIINNSLLTSDANIIIDENNYFYKNEENYPLFWKSSSKYQLGTIVYDDF